MRSERTDGSRGIKHIVEGFKGLEKLYHIENNKKFYWEKDELCNLMSSRGLEPSTISDIKHSISDAYWYHFGEKRFTGEHYISHPLSVAIKLAYNFYIPNSELEAHIRMAIAHDLPENTAITREQLESHTIHDVVTKGVLLLSRIFKTEGGKKESRRENFHKILASGDLPTMRVKIADWEHNLETTPSPAGEINRRRRRKAKKLQNKFAETSEFVLPLIREFPEPEAEYLYSRIQKVYDEHKPPNSPALSPLHEIAA